VLDAARNPIAGSTVAWTTSIVGANARQTQFRQAQCTSATAVAQSVDEITKQFLNTSDVGRGRSNSEYVQHLNYSFLRRSGDLAGFNHWVSLLSTGMTKESQESLQRQHLLFQQLADFDNQLLYQPVPLQQVAKTHNRRFVRRHVGGQIDPGQPTDRFAVVQRVLHRRVGQVDPLLHEVDAQHPRQRVPRPALLRPPGVRLDHRQQAQLRNHRIHFGEKLRPERDIALQRPIHRSQCRPIHLGDPLVRAIDSNHHSDTMGFAEFRLGE